MTSRTRTWAESSASSATDPELTELGALYARHAPDLQRSDQLPLLLAAARGHLRLAGVRAAGEPLIRVREPEEEPGAGPVVEIVTDDMPFLVESLLAGVARAGAEAQRVIHPIVVVRRDAHGELVEVLTAADPAAPPADAMVESWIHLDLLPTDVAHADLERELARVLRDVREVVEDAEPMVRRARQVADALPQRLDLVDGTRPADVAELLRWLADGHFT
ncbi:MAG TPA: NAD-glutamate dehydrogenase, partial [Pseudonocardia sp.]|nr:NAD-glutamate dehydrogenase [Pseudonocardia sp.]